MRLLQADADGQRVPAQATSARRRLDDVRLRRAVEYMMEHLEEDIGLAEIAAAGCFSSQANFTRAFRQHAGMTPGQYRALRRGR